MVAVPDWQLVERIEREFRPYTPAGVILRFIGSDERSQYQENGLDAFKRLVEEQDEPPHTIQVMGFGNNGKAQHAPLLPLRAAGPPAGQRPAQARRAHAGRWSGSRVGSAAGGASGPAVWEAPPLSGGVLRGIVREPSAHPSASTRSRRHGTPTRTGDPPRLCRALEQPE